MTKQVRVLHVLFDLGSGGVETFLYNFYSNMDRSKVHFDFMIHNNSSEVGNIERDMISAGSTIYRVTPAIENFLKSSWEIIKIILKSDYDIIHVHTKNLGFIPLMAAKIRGIKTRISHSRSIVPRKHLFYNIVSQLFNTLTVIFSNYRFACSVPAGKSLFGKRSFRVINNAIEVEKFLYNDNIRKKERERLKVDDKFVIALVGRYDVIKNHEFALRLFKLVNEVNSDTVLIFLGNGEGNTYNNIQQKIKELNLHKSVICNDYRRDVWNFIQAVDLLILPSKSEGFGTVAVEAQVSGAFCLCSTGVPRDVEISNNIDFLPLEIGEEKWAERVLRYVNDIKDYNRANDSQDYIESNFNIEKGALELQEFYLSRSKEIEN